MRGRIRWEEEVRAECLQPAVHHPRSQLQAGGEVQERRKAKWVADVDKKA